ncbi:MAG: O-antigen ligase family protein [Actinomycetota bacterium]
METERISGPAVRERLAAFRRGLLLFVAGAIPLLYLPGITNDAYQVPKVSLLLIGTSLAAALRILEIALGASAAGLRRSLIPVAALGLPLCAAWAMSPYKSWELWGQYLRLQGLIPSLTVLLFGALLVDAFRGGAAARRIAWAMAISGGIVGVHVMVQMAGLDPSVGLITSGFASGTVGHSNLTGGFLAVTLPLCVVLWNDGGRGGRFGLLLTVAVGVGIIGTFSQGAWAAAVAGTCITAGMMLVRRSPRAPIVGWGAATLIGTLLAGVVVVSLFSSKEGLVGGSIATRGLHWSTAVDIFSEYPVLGRGPSSYAIESPLHRSSLESLWMGQVLADDPHSAPLAALVNAGAVGGIGYAIAGVWVVRRLRHAQPGPMRAAFAGAVGAYLIQSLVGIDVISLRVAMWACIAGAVALSGEGKETGPEHSSPGRPRPQHWAAFPVALVLLAICAVLAVAGWRLFMADYHIKQGRNLIDAGRNDEAIGQFTEAISLSSIGDYKRIMGEELTQASPLDESQRKRLLGLTRTAFDQISDVPHLQWVVSRGHQMDEWSQYQPSLEDEAQSVFERAQELDPSSVLPGVRVADLQLRAGDFQAALKTLRPYAGAIARSPDFIPAYPEVWGALALAQWGSGDVVGALESLEVAAGMDLSECHVLIARALIQRSDTGRASTEAAELGAKLSCDRPTAALLELTSLAQRG